eukprot:364298-Chlamydomonas_euryale.AAC.20
MLHGVRWWLDACAFTIVQEPPAILVPLHGTPAAHPRVPLHAAHNAACSSCYMHVCGACCRVYDDSSREGGREWGTPGSSLRQSGRGSGRGGRGGGRDSGRSGSRDSRAPFRETRFTEDASVSEQAPRRGFPSTAVKEPGEGDRAPRRDFRTFGGPRNGDRAVRRDFRSFDGPRNGDGNASGDGDGNDNEDPDEEWEGDGYAQPGAGRDLQDGDTQRVPTIRDELAGTVLYGVFPVLNALKAKRWAASSAVFGAGRRPWRASCMGWTSTNLGLLWPVDWGVAVHDGRSPPSAWVGGAVHLLQPPFRSDTHHSGLSVVR